MLELIGAAATISATVAGYLGSRRFVRARLRFVDAVQKPGVSLVAGVAAAAVAAPVVAIVPLIGVWTAVLFGAGVGTGVAHGARDIRRGTGYQLEP